MSTLIFALLLAAGLGYLARTLYRRTGVLLKVAPVGRFDGVDLPNITDVSIFYPVPGSCSGVLIIDKV